jgi:hypothetical protein
MPITKSKTGSFGKLLFLMIEIVSNFGFRSFGIAQDMVSNL